MACEDVDMDVAYEDVDMNVVTPWRGGGCGDVMWMWMM